MGRAANWRKVKTHLTYTYDEAARALGVHKRTVIGWGRKGLPIYKDQRPHLMRGCDIRDHLREGRDNRKTPLKATTFYCFKCRTARDPAEGMVDCTLPPEGPAMLQALCSVCTTPMFKRTKRDRIPELRRKLDVTVRQGDGTL